MANNTEAIKFFDLIAEISRESKLNIVDFEVRIRSLYDIKLKIRRLRSNIDLFLTNRKEANRKTTLKKIKSLKELLSKKFWRFLVEERKIVMTEDEVIKEEEELLSRKGLQQLEEYDILRKSIENKTLGEETKKRIEEIITSIKEIMEEEALDISIDKHLEELFEVMEKVYKNEAKNIKNLYEELNKLEEEINALTPNGEITIIKEILMEIWRSRINWCNT